MPKITALTTNISFENAFKRCSKDYKQLEMYVAWIGNPKTVVPFEYLHNLSKVTAVIGVSFCQTHPDGIQFLRDLKTDLRIAIEKVLYHPKVYIFTDHNKKAVFIGSSNFTYHGFYENHETNILIEGSGSDKVIADLETDVKKYRTKDFSFVPDDKWLTRYAERYKKRRDKLKAAEVDDEAEEEANAAAWLVIADWEFYLKKFRKELKVHTRKFGGGLPEMLRLFNLYSSQLAIPWNEEYFKDKEKRKMIGGMYEYGWLGHVAASGDFRRMLANGTSNEYKIIIDSINSIAELSIPIDWEKLQNILNNLVSLRPSMKVWGRLLALVRPDVFCTISAPQVRKKIVNTLQKPESFFEEVDGYVMLIQLIHSSPWFKSNPPKSKNEIEIWKRRVAFLDVVFYD